jgi:Tol biopolymer transport system component
VAVGLALIAGISLGVEAGATSGSTQIVSIRTNGDQGNDMSGRFAGPAISANGQIVAFDSIARTLVGSDTNRKADVFVHDRTTNTTERVSVRSNGNQSNGTSTRPSIDARGQVVAFDSDASNLVAGDTNLQMDVFVHNRATNRTTRVSVSSEEAQGEGSSHSPSISASGRYVAFTSTAPNLVPFDNNNAEDIFVRDLVAGTTERVSNNSLGQEGNSSTTLPSISAGGRFVVFSSFATNLVLDDTNGHFDVFIHDRETDSTEMVSLSGSEAQGDAPSTRGTVSANGQLVAFLSDATNLVPSDTNARTDVFVRDRAAGTTERVSVSSDGRHQPGPRGPGTDGEQPGHHGERPVRGLLLLRDQPRAGRHQHVPAGVRSGPRAVPGRIRPGPGGRDHGPGQRDGGRSPIQRTQLRPGDQ